MSEEKQWYEVELERQVTYRVALYAGSEAEAESQARVLGPDYLPVVRDVLTAVTVRPETPELEESGPPADNPE
jgi:hypothetical protein